MQLLREQHFDVITQAPTKGHIHEVPYLQRSMSHATSQQAAQAHTWPDTGRLERGTRTHAQGISAAGSRCHTIASETFTRKDSWSRRLQAIVSGDRCSGRALSGAIRAFCLLVALGVQQPVRVQALPSAPSQLTISSVTKDSATISW